jgi:exodeoxyribonuclease V alpha subunit
VRLPDGTVVAAFDRGPSAPPLLVPRSRLPSVETPWAMTVHKAQGSEAERVTVILPPSGSRLLTRELLYTAVTRARSMVRLVGTEDAVSEAVTRRARRASGLARSD